MGQLQNCSYVLFCLRPDYDFWQVRVVMRLIAGVQLSLTGGCTHLLRPDNVL
jgi:hypothetical protein